MTQTGMRALGAQISHMLSARGVEVIFGIPGVHNQEMYRGIEQAGIRHILARNEQGAGFMADGYARATGRPGVAYVITGPGLCNIMNPMGQAYSDSIPMLVISSCLDETAARRGQLHQMKDQRAAAEMVCDWSHEARTAEAAYLLIDRALEEFQTQRPRPKHIQVPISVLEAMAAPPKSRADAGLQQMANIGIAPPPYAVARELIAAKRPLFIFGGGLRNHIDNSGPPIERYVRDAMTRSGAAAFTTYAGRGLLGETHPMDFGASLARPESAEIIAQADLVIAIGTELSEVDLWRHDLGHKGPLVRVDADPQVLVDQHRAEHRILSSGHDFLFQLNQLLPDETPPKWDAAMIAGTRGRWRAQVDAERPGIVVLAEALGEAAPTGTTLYSDMTQFAYVAKEVVPMPFCGLWHHPSGFGTLGYALPAAIGGKLGRGDLPVISISGDSGFQYNIQELATAVELGLSIPFIVWDNGKLGEIEDSMTRAQIAPNAVIARNPDFCKLALAYGARASAPRSIGDFKQAVREALEADGPTVIHITPETGGR